MRGSSARGTRKEGRVGGITPPGPLLLALEACACYCPGKRTQLRGEVITLRLHWQHPLGISGFCWVMKNPSPGAWGYLGQANEGSAALLSADLNVLPTGLVTHAGKLVANPIFGEARKSLWRDKQDLSALLSEMHACYFLPLHFILAQIKAQVSLENIVKIYPKVSYLSQSTGSRLGPRGVARGTCRPLAAGAVSRSPGPHPDTLLPFLNRKGYNGLIGTSFMGV